jgi:hypothetical protein
LLQLPRAGGFELPGTSSVPSRVELAFQGRLAGLSPAARRLRIAHELFTKRTVDARLGVAA